MESVNQSTNLPLSAIGALALGQKIQAIKIVRSERSLGLKEAKELVEAYEKEHPDIRPQAAIEKNNAPSLWLWLTSLFLVMMAMCWRLYFSH